MKFDISFLKAIGAAVIAYGLIFFIALRIYNNSNNMRRCVFSLIVGGSLVTLNIIGLAFDYLLYGFSEEYIIVYSKLFAFPIMAIVFTIVIPLIFFIMGKARNQKFKNEFKYYSKKREKEKKTFDKKAKPTVDTEENKFLYLVLKYNDDILLKEVVNAGGVKEYSGLIVKINKGENFHDELINKVVETLELDINTYALVGKVSQKKDNDKDSLFYVYTIDLNSINPKIEDFNKVSPVVLYGYNLNNFNKQILFRVVLKEYFEITI